jgi:hypothetical protein
MGSPRPAWGRLSFASLLWTKLSKGRGAPQDALPQHSRWHSLDNKAMRCSPGSGFACHTGAESPARPGPALPARVQCLRRCADGAVMQHNDATCNMTMQLTMHRAAKTLCYRWLHGGSGRVRQLRRT